jgi:hypothetical protein
MGNPAGVRRDFDALEKRRLEAIRMWESGLNQSAVARWVKVVLRSRTAQPEPLPFLMRDSRRAYASTQLRRSMNVCGS